MIGAEVLVRWNQNGTYVSPAEFIPVFEENGFIYRMDYAIWEQACALLRRWMDEGKTPVPLSVNVSGKDILQAGVRHFDADGEICRPRRPSAL